MRRKNSPSQLSACCILCFFTVCCGKKSDQKIKENLPGHFVKTVDLSLSFPPHRLLSGGQGPTSVLAGIRSPGCAPWVHVGRGEVPLPP